MPNSKNSQQLNSPIENTNQLTTGKILLRYGDADLSSKRRKLQTLPEEETTTSTTTAPLTNSEEEYLKFEKFASETCMNSSFVEFLEQNLDFKGGLLSKANRRRLTETIQPLQSSPSSSLPATPTLTSTVTTTILSSSPNSTTELCSLGKQSAKNDLIITTKPSQASKGFENTFKLLESHVACRHNTISPSKLSETELPTRLDLELEARQRLQTLLSNVSNEKVCTRKSITVPAATAGNDKDCTCCSTKPLVDFLHDFSTKHEKSKFNLECSQNLSENNSKDELSEPDIDVEPVGLNLLYHATKSPDGSNCLRVIRNLPVLKNKVLCGNRVSQMTRTYDDIEAVTRLLEEKEKDLELTVQIGKELLTQNNTLENRIADLEADLKTSNDDRAQLIHELTKKNELIAVLTNDADDGSEAETPTFSKSLTFDLLQRKVSSLQDENKSLKMEASQLAKQTDDVEAHERQLMEDITTQLNDANSQFDGLSLELERQREENRLQHEQIVSLTARLAEAEMRLHQLTHDNDEHVTLLNITKENQNSLALELVEFKQRYQEVLALLQETQEQLRKHRKRTMPQARSGSFMSSMGASGIGMSGSGYGFLQPESLQSELMESSMYSENSMDSGISSDRDRANDRIGRLMSQLANNGGCGSNSIGASIAGATSALGGASGRVGGVGGIGDMAGAVPPYQRIFDTVRCASKNANYADNSGGSLSMSQMGAMSMSSSSGPRMSASALPAGSYYRPDSIYEGANAMGGGRTLSCESLASHSDDNYPSQPAGVPGAPGAKDLEAALKRLTPAEVLARRAMLSYAPAGTYNYDEQHHQQQKYQQLSSTLPMGVRTPDSIMSTGSSGISSTAHMSASSMHTWRLPEKLQIVKPMEGSQTLHHWSRLATPTLSGLLEERPGVSIRGGRGLDDLGMQIYTLEDVEEDISEDLPGKQFQTPGYVYTYTNSMVMHPDDGFVNDLSFLSQSQMSSRMASTSTSRQPSCPPTPRSGLSRKNSCSTFSVNLGLAGMLNERGIKAVTPSALNTPAGPNFTPTVTPCNSPEGSPTRSRSPEPLFGLLSSGADLIRRKLMGVEIERPTRNQQKQQQQKIMLSRLERRALRSLRLVEKVESIGLENIISTQPCAMSQLASGIANRSSSPLSQLKSLHTSTNSIVDDIHFERDHIKSVLHKGLNKSNTSSNTSLSSYNSDNDDTVSGSSSDSNYRDIHRTPTNAIKTPTNAAFASASSSSSFSSAIQTSNINSSSTLNAQNINTTSTKAPKSGAVESTGGTAAATVALPSQTESRIKQMQRQKSRRNLKNGMAAQRPDLGTISSGGGASGSGGSRVRNDLGRVATTVKTAEQQQQQQRTSKGETREEAQQSYTQSFVGTVSSLLFGRKGGWQ